MVWPSHVRDQTQARLGSARLSQRPAPSRHHDSRLDTRRRAAPEKAMRHLITVTLAAVLVAGCAWIDRVDPTLPASSPTWIHCLDEAGNYNGLVCPEGKTCGGGKYSVGCPADSCCDIGNMGLRSPMLPVDGGAP